MPTRIVGMEEVRCGKDSEIEVEINGGMSYGLR